MHQVEFWSKNKLVDNANFSGDLQNVMLIVVNLFMQFVTFFVNKTFFGGRQVSRLAGGSIPGVLGIMMNAVALRFWVLVLGSAHRRSILIARIVLVFISDQQSRLT